MPRSTISGFQRFHARPSRCAVLTLCFAAGLAAWPAATASAQQSNVFVDDSVTASESLQRFPDLLAAGNAGEVIRVIQRLLDEEGDRLVVSPADPRVFISVRTRVHGLMLTDNALLERYRELESARADKLLEEGRVEAVERSRLLTSAGLRAVVRLARRDMEAGRFDGAALVLKQALTHPDLRGPAAQEVADLALQIARYTQSGAARDLAEAAARSAGRSFTPAPAIAAPARARLRTPEIAEDRGPLDPASIASEPLASAPVATFVRPSRPGLDRLAVPWTVPSIAGDVLYTNDGVEVAAWDRWTMAPLWRQAVTGEDEESSGFPDQSGQNLEHATRSLEDVSTVSVGSGVVLAATGYAVSNGRRSGDARIHAFDPATGSPLWAVNLASLDGSVAEATVRGPIVIVGDTAIVAADRFSTGRRLASSLLVGIDCSTGAVRWSRTLANVGLTSIGRMSRPADLPMVLDGVVYMTDSLGVTAAVEAASGRFVWVRQLEALPGDPNAGFFLRGDALPWLGLAVVEHGGSIFTVEPGQNQLVQLAKADGRLIAKRPLDSGEQPRSVMLVGQRLALLGPFRIDFIQPDNIRQAPLEALALPAGVGLSGRPLVSAGRLVVPVDEGLLFVDPAAPASPLTRTLPVSGHPVIAGGQLLIASLWDVQSFQSWESIEPKLTEAIERRPRDAGPGIAYLRIALKAGRTAGIPAVADRLLAAMDQDPADTDLQAARRTLFVLLRDAIAGVRDGVPGVTIELPQIDAMLARVGRAADTPSERAEHLLLTAWSAEAQSRAGAAVEALQAVLQDAELAQAVVPARGVLGFVALPGWQAARFHLATLLRKSGYEAYAPFAAQAEREKPPTTSTAEVFEAFARRFPLAGASVQSLAAAAEARLAQGQSQHAIDNLGAAMDAARTIATAARKPMGPEISAVAGRFLGLLVAGGRDGEAHRFLASLSADLPGLTLTDGSVAIDRDAFTSRIAGSLGSRDRRASVGAVLQPGPQFIPGWLPVRSRFSDGPGRATDQLPMYAPATRQIAVWARRSEDGRLAPLWTRNAEPRALPPTFLRVDWDGALVYWPGDKGASVECIDVTGQTRWRTEALSTLFPPQPDAEGVRGATPQDGDVAYDGMMVVISGETLVLLKRSGIAAGFDLRSGKSLWARKLDFSLIFDATGAGDHLVVAGEFEDAQDPRIVFVDLRTGQPQGALGSADERLASRPRWLRPAGGSVIIGFEDSVRCVDPKQRTVQWTITGASAAGAIECWPLGDRVLILGGDSRPWMVDPRATPPEPIPMETAAGLADLRRTLGPDDWSRTVLRADGAVVVGTENGLWVLDALGAIVGRDTLRNGKFLTAFGDRLAVYVQTDVEPDRDGRREVTVWTLELASAKLVGEQRLVLYDNPTRLGVLDGKVVLTAGSASSPATLVFDAAPQASR